MRGTGGARPAAFPRLAAPPAKEARLVHLFKMALTFMAGLLALGYAAVWSVPPLHRLAVETVVTTGHAYLAHLIATPAQFAAARAQWLDTPNISAITAAETALAPQQPAAPVSAHAISGSTYRGWVLLVRNPALVHVVVTSNVGHMGEQVSQFGQQYHALAAINGGGFQDPDGQGSGGLPVGVTASFGHLSYYPDLTGDYVIGFDALSRLAVGKWTLQQARALGLRDAVSFKPLLVASGKPQITSGDGGWGIAPRTAIGQRKDGTVVFVVIDGRQPGSIGATLRQMQSVMLREGAVTAVNLDGGSSATLWYHGRVVNNPCCSPNGQRYIATAFIVTQ
jgi:exopolysaccharide biosynthesis protein